MKEVSKKLFPVIAPIFLLYAVYFTLSAVIAGNTISDLQIAVSSELEDISQADIDEVKKEARKALNLIPPILGIKYRSNATIKIVGGGICNERDGVILLPIMHVRGKNAAIIHELTHIIAKHGNNSFFSEGLAVYFQERFGENHGFPNFFEPLDSLVKKHEKQLNHLTKLMNDNEIFSRVGTEQRKIAYAEAGSFFNFLVLRYGEQKLADLHNSPTLNYEQVYGKKVDALEAEWKSYVLEGSGIKI